MIKENIKKSILAYDWERWLERPYHAFALSLFEDSSSKKSFEKLGLKGIDSRPQLFQEGFWYLCKEEMQKMDVQVENHLKSHSIFDITESLDAFKKKSEDRIKVLIQSSLPLEIRFAEFFEIMSQAATFIWLAHGLESFFQRKLKVEVPKYISVDIDKFIGDASFPNKKNTHTVLDTMMTSSVSSKQIAETAGWVKIRDGFSDPFTEAEIDKMRQNLKVAKEFQDVKIPEELKVLFSHVRELVFFRTERTDVFYLLFFQARPLLRELAKKYNISFKELSYYRAKSFIEGRVERYSNQCSFGFDGENVLFQDDPILVESNTAERNEISGMVAFRGKVSGKVSVVTDTSELDKVESGDILVTQMTFPSFISALHKAAAFVTDEGGITCHAAIVAREMKKPCIIGTKNATRVLKDGDIVEVDAERGIVKKLD